MQIKNKKVAAKGGAVGAVIATILGVVFTMEGGYVNNPKDPGGETNHGITKAVALSHKILRRKSGKLTKSLQILKIRMESLEISSVKEFLYSYLLTSRRAHV